MAPVLHHLLRQHCTAPVLVSWPHESVPFIVSGKAMARFRIHIQNVILEQSIRSILLYISITQYSTTWNFRVSVRLHSLWLTLCENLHFVILGTRDA